MQAGDAGLGKPQFSGDQPAARAHQRGGAAQADLGLPARLPLVQSGRLAPFVQPLHSAHRRVRALGACRRRQGCRAAGAERLPRLARHVPAAALRCPRHKQHAEVGLACLRQSLMKNLPLPSPASPILPLPIFNSSFTTRTILSSSRGAARLAGPPPRRRRPPPAPASCDSSLS